MILPVAFLAIAIFLAPLRAALPEEALWSPIVAGLILAAAAWESARALRHGAYAAPGRIALVTGGYAAWAFLALLWRWLAVDHGRPAYTDAMARTVLYWLACAAFVLYLQPLLKTTAARCACLGALAASAAIASYLGLQDYMIHVAAHQATWREFGTSTPDYFAGFLVMTIPVTLALFVGAPSRKAAVGPLTYALALAPQVPVLFTTGSRFALAALAASVVVLVASFLLARSSGSRLDRSQIVRIGAIVVLLAVAGLVVARPVAHRLSKSVAAEQKHSGDFRIWTWRGALKMAERNPVFGAGPGTFAFTYQKYALVGYTRVAHDAYLQTADEIGAPGLILLLAALAMIGARCFSSLRTPSPAPETVAEAAPAQSARRSRRPAAPVQAETAGQRIAASFVCDDNKLLACGVLAGAAAGLLQNLIDSDWYFTFDGVTLWLLIGLALSLCSDLRRDEAAPSTRFGRYFAVKGAVACSVAALVLFLWAAAESQAMVAAQQAASADADGPADAFSLYQTAMELNPLRASYPSRRALLVDPKTNPSQIGPDLTRAAELEPTGAAFRRLAAYDLTSSRPADALVAAEQGLKVEPAYVKLWNLAAQANLALGRPQDARRDYERAADIETSPVGTVLAVTEVVNVDYVDADLYLGDAYLAEHRPDRAAACYSRAVDTLAEYAGEGGTTDPMRMAQIGDEPNADLDTRMRDDYERAADGLIAALSALHSPRAAAVSAAKAAVLAKFAAIIARASTMSAPQ